jgi:integrase
MPRRRGKGEGSITERPDGRWEGRIDLGWRDGKRERKFVYGRTRKAVVIKVRKALEQTEQGIPFADERQTVERFLRRWLDHMQTRLRPRTWAGYASSVRLHLVPKIGKVSLTKLTPAHVEAALHLLQQDGTTPGRVRYARTVLRAALNRAQKWQLVTRNVATLVDPPRYQGKEIQPLTPEQARTLIATARDHRLGAIVSVATALGLRQGEALGLRWQDVDFDGGTLSVRQALERSGGDSAARRSLAIERRELRKRISATAKRSPERRELAQQLEANRSKWRKLRSEIRFVEPKSARSRRTIRMPQIVITALKAHRKRQLEERMALGNAWQDSGLVFTSPIGTPMEPRNMTREFHKMLKDADVPRVRFHDLRHTAATLLLAQGVDPRTIMETLGHSQISLTLNTYSHVLPALQAEAAAKLDAILSR